MRSKRLFTAIVLGLGLTLALLLLLSPGLLVVRAANFTVDTAIDENDGSCVDGDCSLRDAIILANGNGQADTITLAAGTFTLTIPGVDEHNAATGDLNITDALTIIGAGPGQTIINGNGIERVFEIFSAETVVISGVTIFNGTTLNGQNPSGGGIDSSFTDLALINTIVSSNTGGFGGGVSISSGNATLNGTHFLNNIADIGGGVYISNSSVTLNGGQIISNSAFFQGGGVFVGFSTLTQTGVTTIAHNTVTGSFGGGGLYISQSSVTLNGGQIISNSALNGGGVTLAFGPSTFTQTGGTIAYNTASDDGGGTINNGGGVMMMLSSSNIDFVQLGGTIAYNTAEDHGGGVYLNPGNITSIGGEIIHNSAGGNGGGLYVNNGKAMLTSTIILTNSASDGGGLFQEGGSDNISVSNSCIVNNSDTSIDQASGPTVIATNNWWGAADGPSGAGPGQGDSVGIDVDFSGFFTVPILGCPTKPLMPQWDVFLPTILKN